MTWRAHLFIARDFLAFELPRRRRRIRRAVGCELAQWATPATALDRFLLPQASEISA